MVMFNVIAFDNLLITQVKIPGAFTQISLVDCLKKPNKRFPYIDVSLKHLQPKEAANA